MISKSVLDDIRFRCDIVDIIDAYITLPRKSGAIKTLCPFHKEKTPSFHVNQQRQMFHCFGCGAGGDVFKFVMMHEQVDFMTAVRILAEKAGVPIEFEPGSQASGEREVLLAVHEKLATAYHTMLRKSPEAQEAREYLARRGLTPEIVDSFLIGYATDKRNAMIEWGHRNNFTPATLQQAGILARREQGDGAAESYYDRFHGRVMFPIRNEQGRVIGFSGRALVKDAKIAKYVNSPETPIFHKSHVLYALDRARREIAEKREAIVCEGQIDVIRCHQAGFTHAVAAQGTAFTDDHARILRRYADGVILVFDSDEAGRNAALKAGVVFLRAGLAVRVASLPPGEDPDSLILKEGPASFARILQQAVPALDFQINQLMQRNDIRTEAGLVRVSRTVLATISQAPNAIQREVLLNSAARRLNVAVSALQSELRPLLRKAAATEPETQAAAATEVPRQEELLAEHLGASPELADLVQAYLPLHLITHPLCRRFIATVLESRRERQDLTAAITQSDDEARSLSTFAARILSAPAKAGTESTHRDAVEALILNIWRLEWQRKRRDLEQQAVDTTHETDKDALVAQAQQLTTDIKRLQKWSTAEPVLHLYLDSQPANTPPASSANAGPDTTMPH